MISILRSPQINLNPLKYISRGLKTELKIPSKNESKNPSKNKNPPVEEIHLQTKIFSFNPSNQNNIYTQKLRKYPNIEDSKKLNFHIDRGHQQNARGFFFDNSEKGNKLTSKMTHSLTCAVKLFNEHCHVHGMFLRSLGDDFCAGRALEPWQDGFELSTLLEEYILCHEINESDVPLCALMHGKNRGPGMAFAMHSSYGMASLDATCAFDELFKGWFPDLGRTWRLANLPWEGTGLWLGLTGTELNAYSMRKLGIIQQILPLPHTLDDIRADFGLSFYTTKDRRREAMDFSIRTFADVGFQAEPTARYLPFIDLCFGGSLAKSTLESVLLRLKSLQIGDLKGSMRIRLDIGEFSCVEYVRKFDEKVPEVLKRWAGNCIVKIMSIEGDFREGFFGLMQRVERAGSMQEAMQEELIMAQNILLKRSGKEVWDMLETDQSFVNLDLFPKKAREEVLYPPQDSGMSFMNNTLSEERFDEDNEAKAEDSLFLSNSKLFFDDLNDKAEIVRIDDSKNTELIMNTMHLFYKFEKSQRDFESKNKVFERYKKDNKNISD